MIHLPLYPRRPDQHSQLYDLSPPYLSVHHPIPLPLPILKEATSHLRGRQSSSIEKPKIKKKSNSDKGTAVLQPAGTLYLKYILRIKDKCNITNPCLPVTKGIHNTKGASLCLLLLLGGHSESTETCGYHLQVNDPDHLPGTSNTGFAPFHDCLAASKE